MSPFSRLVPIAVLAALALTAPARGEIIVLQQGLGGYEGVEDTWTGNSGSYYNLGGSDEMRGYSDLGEARFKSLVRFGGLDGAIPVSDPGQITSATLMLYKHYGQSAEDYGSVTAYRVLRPWVEGTGRGAGLDNTKPIDGANLRCWAPATSVTEGWSQVDGYANVHELDVTGLTIDHLQYNFAIYAGQWTARSSIQEVEDNLNSFYQDGDVLYFSTDRPDLRDNHGLSYYVVADRWDGSSCTGDADINKAESLTGDWPDETDAGWGSIDVTEWVRTWFADPGSNFGVLLTAGGKEIGWRTSEHNAGTPESPDYTLGPKLVVEYVPEPGTLALLGLGACTGILRRHRSRDRRA